MVIFAMISYGYMNEQNSLQTLVEAARDNKVIH